MTIESKILLPSIIRRIHPRAKRLRLRIVQGQIFLTIPPDAKIREIEQFIQHSQAWLHQNYMIADQPPSETTHADDFLIDQNSLSIFIINKEYKVKLVDKIKDWKENYIENEILIKNNQPAKQLTAWVLTKSKRELPKRLAKLEAKHDFSYQKCSVRHAKTRWGSCNQQGSISLNAGLALLDQETLDYVLLHELCHTRHMNHSSQFWAEVEKVCPSYQAQRKLLQQFRWPIWWRY